MDGMPLDGGDSKTAQILHSDSATGSNMPSSTSGRLHDREEDQFPRSKKLSILGRMKEKAKKWRQSFGKRRQGDDANTTPSWGVSLEDYEVEEDPKCEGSSICELEQAADCSKQKTRLHPEPDPIVSEKNAIGSSCNNHSGDEEPLTMKKMTSGPTLSKSHSDHQGGKSAIPKMKLKGTLTAPSIGFHKQEGVSNLSNAGKEKEKSKGTVEDVIDKSTAYDEKGKLPMTIKADQDLKKTTSLNKVAENEASKSDHAGKKQDQKAPATQNVKVCEANLEGTSKIQDLPQPSSTSVSSLMKGESSSSRMLASMIANEAEDENQGRILQTN